MRRKPPTTSTEQPTVALRAHDPSSAAMAIGDDPALLQRYGAARAQGMPEPDLTDVPKFNHAQHVFQQIQDHERSFEPEPCGICGTTTRRYGLHRTTDANGNSTLPPTPPEFALRTIGTGTSTQRLITLCAWCNDAIAMYGEVTLKRRVFRILAGIQGDGTTGGPGVAWFCDMNSKARHDAPWQYVNRDQVLDAAKQHFSSGPFITLPGQQEQARMAGLVPKVWTASEIRAIDRGPQEFQLHDNTTNLDAEPKPDLEELKRARRAAARRGRPVEKPEPRHMDERMQASIERIRRDAAAGVKR